MQMRLSASFFSALSSLSFYRSRSAARDIEMGQLPEFMAPPDASARMTPPPTAAITNPTSYPPWPDDEADPRIWSYIWCSSFLLDLVLIGMLLWGVAVQGKI